MSFGFTEETNGVAYDPIRKAINKATFDRNDQILFFAAAGNEGANLQKVMFPARHELAVPIYGTDATGAFLDKLNPRIKRDGPSIFGTLAKDLPCAGRDEESEVSVTGTSFATAVAAGYAGMLLEYVRLLEFERQVDGSRSFRWRDQLSTRRGMLALFQTIAEQPPDRRYYLNPNHFFQQSEEVRKADIIKAVNDSS